MTTSQTLPECAHCGHPEVAHVNDGDRPICQRCLLLAGLRSARTLPVAPQHAYESVGEIDAHIMRANRAVYALTVGADFVLPGGRLVTVGWPCDAPEDGFWLCVTHMTHFRQNVEKDLHCYAARLIEPHAMVWVCWQHGAEHPGEQRMAAPYGLNQSA